MVLLMVGMLVACQTTLPQTDPIEVPVLASARPTRPTLERLPDDTSEALKTQTINVSRLVRYASDWERFYSIAEDYYQTVIRILQGNPLESGL